MTDVDLTGLWFDVQFAPRRRCFAAGVVHLTFGQHRDVLRLPELIGRCVNARVPAPTQRDASRALVVVLWLPGALRLLAAPPSAAATARL
jgi:hypothetical protein